MGTSWFVSCRSFLSTEACLEKLVSENYQSVATSLRGNSVALHNADLVHLANNGPNVYRNSLDSAGSDSSSESVTVNSASSVECDRVALWFGHEGNGLSPTAISGCNLAIHVEMVGAGDSLGVAACVPLVLQEVLRQRRIACTQDNNNKKVHTTGDPGSNHVNNFNEHHERNINGFPPPSAAEQAALWDRLGNAAPSLPARTERRLAKRKALAFTAGRKDMARLKAAAAVVAATEARQAWAARRKALVAEKATAAE